MIQTKDKMKPYPIRIPLKVLKALRAKNIDIPATVRAFLKSIVE